MSKQNLGLVQFPADCFRPDALHVTVAALFENAQVLGHTFSEDDRLVTYRVIHPSFAPVDPDGTLPFYLMSIQLDDSVTFKPAPVGFQVPLDVYEFWDLVDARFDPCIPF